jgi:hypothetical protein
MFFKQSQKFECATNVVKNLSIDELINNTVFMLKNTNIIYIDYPVLKTFATPEHFDKIVNYICSLIDFCIQTYSNYDVHINLDSFTSSACYRYKGLIESFVNYCGKHNFTYSTKLTKFYIYNTPSSIDSISPILIQLIDPVVREKFVFYKKSDSPILIANLLGVKN